jgi:hypothetical protein
MTLEDALKVLKITTSTPWECIETSRRQAVERARPDRLASLSKEKRSVVMRVSTRISTGFEIVGYWAAGANVDMLDGFADRLARGTPVPNEVLEPMHDRIPMIIARPGLRHRLQPRDP